MYSYTYICTCISGPLPRGKETLQRNAFKSFGITGDLNRCARSCFYPVENSIWRYDDDDDDDDDDVYLSRFKGVTSNNS
jgi:hypothetical protein